MLERCDLLGRGLLQPYSFPTREGNLNAPKILRIQILSMPLPVFAYTFEAELPQHLLNSWLGRSGPRRLVQTHSMLEHEPTQEVRRNQQAATGSGDDISDMSRTLPYPFTGQRCRAASHTNYKPTA